MTTARSSLVLAGELVGRPVVPIDAGDDIAEIREVVYDGEHHRLVGFTLNKRGWFRGRCAERLPAEQVVAIGRDAVMIERRSDLVDPKRTDLPGADALSVLDLTVMTEDGRELGVIDDVVVETGSEPRAVGYRLAVDGRHVYLPIDAQMALSEERMVVPSGTASFVHDDFAGFGASVESHRAALREHRT